MKLLAGGDVHERADKATSSTICVTRDEGALEQLDIGSVSPAKLVFAAPLMVGSFERLAKLLPATRARSSG